VLRVSCGSGAERALGVVSAQTEKVVEFFLEREAAETMIGEVREDEPMLAEDLRVEAIELGLSAPARASFLTLLPAQTEAWAKFGLSRAGKLKTVSFEAAPS
jgi:hypothetical protein